jgi:hypothetical protein
MQWNISSDKTIESCIALMLSFQKVNVDSEKLSASSQSAYDILAEHSPNKPISLTGITLEDALYYITVGRPVFAMKNSDQAVLIYGFDAFNIMMIDPTTGEEIKMGIQDSTNMFKEAGNVFLSYLEQ